MNRRESKTGQRGPTWEAGAVTAGSVLLLAAAWFRWCPLDLTEALGFVTGAVCVWLVTKRNLWNWPIGLANNVFFAVLFHRSRLFADCGLQGVYFILGVYGWWHWLRGGDGHSRAPVSRATEREWIATLAFLVAGTWGLRSLMIFLQGAAPFWDSLTTVLSLAAQYLLCRKRIENWWFWIAADLIYVPLYVARHLPLTAVLYTIFLGLCLLGLRRWRAEIDSPHEPAP